MSRQDGRCNGCQAEGGASRYSFGVYAGFLCVPCARERYVDQCGLGEDGRQGDPSELDEPLEPEPCVGGLEDDDLGELDY